MSAPRRKVKKKMSRSSKLGLVAALLIVAGILAVHLVEEYRERNVTETTYAEFLRKYENEEIKAIRSLSTAALRYVTEDDDVFRAPHPGFEIFLPWLTEAEIPLEPPPGMRMSNILISGTLLLILFLFIIWFFRSLIPTMATGSGKVYEVIMKTGITFANVAGLTQIKDELNFIVESLTNRELLTAMGGRVSRGVLLYGPPGTGKTLLAKAVAGEANVPFISCAGSDFQGSYIAQGTRRISELLETAKENAPCVVFIDEADSLFGERRTGTDMSSDSRNTLNKLLQQMDGMTSTSGILFFAATNSISTFDAAVLRPGRFDRQIGVQPPSNQEDRDAIIAIHLLGKTLAADVTLEQISPYFQGLTGAEIEGILNESVIESVRTDGGGVITLAHIDAAIMKYYSRGVAQGDATEEERERIAAHEAGHTLMNLIVGRGVVRASIKGYGLTGGAVISNTPNVTVRTRKMLRDDVYVAYAGFIAEVLLCEQHSTGCSNDLEKATQCINLMVDKVGMSETLLVSGDDLHRLNDPNRTLKDNLANELKTEATTLLVNNLTGLRILRKRLLDEGTLFNLNSLVDIQ
jgi:cell division protease FtsH